jgi:hypothetical protein
LLALNTEEFVISSGWFAKLSKTVASKPILFAYPSDKTRYTVYSLPLHTIRVTLKTCVFLL